MYAFNIYSTKIIVCPLGPDTVVRFGHIVDNRERGLEV